MTGPQLENGYTQLANELIEDLARTDLTGPQFQLLLVVIRRTFGECERRADGSIRTDETGQVLKKKWAPITTKQFMDDTGLAKSTVLNNIERLIERKILNRIPGTGRKPATYAYQKYREAWEIEGRKSNLDTYNIKKVSGISPDTTNEETEEENTVEVSEEIPQEGGAQMTMKEVAVSRQIPQTNSGSTADTKTEGVAVAGERPPINKDLNKGVVLEPKPLLELLKRYDTRDQDIIKEYWKTIRQTRKTGKLAESVIRNFMDQWEKYPAAAVIVGMQTHIDKYKTSKREDYTGGIIRRIAAEIIKDQNQKGGEGNGIQQHKGDFKQGNGTTGTAAAGGFDRSRYTFKGTSAK